MKAGKEDSDEEEDGKRVKGEGRRSKGKQTEMGRNGGERNIQREERKRGGAGRRGVKAKGRSDERKPNQRRMARI